MAINEELTKLAKRMARLEAEPLEVQRPRGQVLVRAEPAGTRLVDTNVFSRKSRPPRRRVPGSRSAVYP